MPRFGIIDNFLSSDHCVVEADTLEEAASIFAKLVSPSATLTEHTNPRQQDPNSPLRPFPGVRQFLDIDNNISIDVFPFSD